MPLHAGRETSVAATKSYIASLSCLVQLVAELDAAARPVARRWRNCRRSWRAPGNATGARASSRCASAHNLYVVARGFGLAVAQEAALKFKETCGLHAEAFSSAEVRHGPMALVREGFPVLMFAQDDETRSGIEQLGRRVRSARRDRCCWRVRGRAARYRCPA